MPEYILERHFLGYGEDVYRPVQFHNRSYPKCSAPFKALDVNWNGDVPLCSNSVQQVGPPGLITGNMLTHTMDELWRGGLIRQYREAHLTRDAGRMPICQGCTGY